MALEPVVVAALLLAHLAVPLELLQPLGLRTTVAPKANGSSRPIKGGAFQFRHPLGVHANVRRSGHEAYRSIIQHHKLTFILLAIALGVPASCFGCDAHAPIRRHARNVHINRGWGTYHVGTGTGSQKTAVVGLLDSFSASSRL
jgi:hypothetical protein